METLNYKNIILSDDSSYYLYQNERIFPHLELIEGLKFHSEGLAAVKLLKKTPNLLTKQPDLAEKQANPSQNYIWKHINIAGNFIYPQAYQRVFGYYDSKAAVTDFEGDSFHIDTKGERAYTQNYSWVGNYQQERVVVRLAKDYFHLNNDGERYYTENYLYVGDYKDGAAAVKLQNGYYNHINLSGERLYTDKKFLDLGVFHKNIATARDEKGYFHTDKAGDGLYSQRYLQIEPFYNGVALVTNFDYSRLLINEAGERIAWV